MSKTFRLFLLLLLAVLLPVRGALAAAMPCESWAAMPGDTVAMAGEGHHEHHHHEGSASSSAQDKCKHCAACVFSPMTGSEAELPATPVPQGLRYPAWSVSVTAFLSDGLERPPRSV